MIEAAAARETIQVRRMDFDFRDAIPTYWFAGNPFLTALMAGLGVSFPPGERFFIRSVRHFLPMVKNEALRRDVRAFIGQEANHTKEHLAFNAFLDRKGFPASEIEAWVAARIEKIQSHSSPEANLARTVALEHFTAVLATALLEHPEITDRMHPTTAKLWLWHAIEELEHRSVAFDVYKETVDDEALRIRLMKATTVIFMVMNVYRTGWILRACGQLGNLEAYTEGIRLLFGEGGLFAAIWPHYVAFYRPDFHPAQHDCEALLAEARERVLGELS